MNRVELNWPIPSLAETQRLATHLAGIVQPPMSIALNGELGSGKTQLVRFFAACRGVPQVEVTSPTYVLLQRYSARPPILHFDFYRLETAAEVWDLGIDELFEQENTIFIEWAKKFSECLPADHLEVELRNGDRQRHAIIWGTGHRSQQVVYGLQASLAQAQ